MNNKQIYKLITKIARYRWNKHKFNNPSIKKIRRYNIIEDLLEEFMVIE
jgi:hypothetical protein